jgi:hypothetical protein
VPVAAIPPLPGKKSFECRLLTARFRWERGVAAADYRHLWCGDVEMAIAPHDIAEMKVTVKFLPYSGAVT